MRFHVYSLYTERNLVGHNNYRITLKSMYLFYRLELFQSHQETPIAKTEQTETMCAKNKFQDIFLKLLEKLLRLLGFSSLNFNLFI